MRVIGYTRVSTEKQADEGISLEAQEAKLRAYASAFDLELVATLSDAGISAKSLDRPGIQRALAMLVEGAADGILVTKLDRLTRSVRDLGQLLDDYFAPVKRGAKAYALLSVGDSIDTRTAAGRLILNILGSISQWTRENIVEGTAEALAHLKQTGVQLGGMPLGMKRTDREDADGRKVIVAVEKEQAAVRRIVELHQQRKTLREIGAILHHEGFRPKRAARWSAEAVRLVIARTGTFCVECGRVMHGPCLHRPADPIDELLKEKS